MAQIPYYLRSKEYREAHPLPKPKPRKIIYRICSGCFKKKRFDNYTDTGGLCTKCWKAKLARLSKEQCKVQIAAVRDELKERYYQELAACMEGGVCDVLHFHHDRLKHDPEHLTTEFILDLIDHEDKGKAKAYKELKAKVLTDFFELSDSFNSLPTDLPRP